MSEDTIETILVPSDLSDCAPGVVRQAAQLAAAFDAELVVMHSYELPAGLAAQAMIEASPGQAPVAVGTHVRAGVDQRMPALVQLGTDAGVRTRALVVEGKPVETILASAVEVDAGIIVMGTHGRRGLNRLLLGSVAEAVLRRSDVPVMTVRSRRDEGCEAKSCAVCTTHVTPEVQRVSAELDG
jgi:nucleotide-binding universal stress UspA family protein